MSLKPLDKKNHLYLLPRPSYETHDLCKCLVSLFDSIPALKDSLRSLIFENYYSYGTDVLKINEFPFDYVVAERVFSFFFLLPYMGCIFNTPSLLFTKFPTSSFYIFLYIALHKILMVGSLYLR